MQLLNSQTISYHHSWDDFLADQEEILDSIGENIRQVDSTPNERNILRFLSVDLAQVRIVILGQDPYPQKGVATGRAFEVGTLKSWAEKFANVSLKNMLRAIYKAEHGKVIKYSDLVKNELNQTFTILSPARLFEHWEQQGVLLLNTSFTCEIGKPGSHAKLWQPFTRNLLIFIAKQNQQAKWFLWGDHAMKAVEKIDIEDSRKISSFHPMMCYNRPNDFLYATPNCFEQTWNIIDWTGFRNHRKSIAQSKLF